MRLTAIPITLSEYKEIAKQLSEFDVKSDFYLPPKIYGNLEELFMCLDTRTNNVVAFWAMFEYHSDGKDKPWSTIFVMPPYRGRGLAKAVYTACMREADLDWVYVSATNKDSVRAHSKFGTFLKKEYHNTFLIERKY